MNWKINCFYVRRPAAGALLLALLFCQRITVFALSPAREIEQYVRRSWTVENGLPNNSVWRIEQTADGYLWLATQDGLARFDGVEFTVFNKQTTAGLPGNYIMAMREDRNRDLWIGTRLDGVSRRRADGETRAFAQNDGLPSNLINSIIERRNGEIAIATNGGLSFYRDNQFHNLTARDNLPAEGVWSLYETGNNDLWLGTTTAGLIRYRDNAELLKLTVENGLPDNFVSCFYEDRSGRLWIGTQNGIALFTNGKLELLPETSRQEVEAITADRDGNIWIGTYKGLYRFALDRITARPQLTDKLEGLAAVAICEDREGNLWIGTLDKGLIVLKNGKFTTYTTAQGLTDDYVTSVLQDRAGTVWVGSRNGLSRFAADKFSAVPDLPDFSVNKIEALLEDRRGAMWIAAVNGLLRLENNQTTVYTEKNGLPEAHIRNLAEDRDGRLWLLTERGRVVVFDHDNFSDAELPELNERKFRTLFGLPDGTLVFGKTNEICFLQSARLSCYNQSDGYSGGELAFVYQDHENYLWIGTNGSGLNRFKDGQFKILTTQDGLYGDAIYAVLPDEHDNFWFTGNKGVFRINRRELMERADNAGDKVHSITFGTADGMRSVDCAGGDSPSAWKARDGRFWIPTAGGVTVIDASNLPFNEIPPPVFVERLTVDNAPFALQAENLLRAGSDRLEFSFTGLSYQDSERVKFRYRLEGYDADWRETNRFRQAIYTNLPPGDYRFIVTASNNDGVWNQTPAIVAFTINPFFYQTRWFAVLCLFAVGCLGYGFYLFRLRQIKQRYEIVLEERVRLARELHDTLLQGFVGINSQLGSVLMQLPQAPELARRSIELAQRMAAHSVTEARRAIHDLRGVNQTEQNLSNSLQHIVSQIAEGVPVKIALRINGKPSSPPPLVAEQIVRIVEEAVTNALKHTEATRISVTLNYRANETIVAVIDNGAGFDERRAFSDLDGHFGMLGMRERAQKINGKLTVRSVLTKGTTVTLTVPPLKPKTALALRNIDENGDGEDFSL